MRMVLVAKSEGDAVSIASRDTTASRVIHETVTCSQVPDYAGGRARVGAPVLDHTQLHDRDLRPDLQDERVLSRVRAEELDEDRELLLNRDDGSGEEPHDERVLH